MSFYVEESELEKEAKQDAKQDSANYFQEVPVPENITKQLAATNELGGKRFSKGKIRFDLIPPDAILEIARVYTRGSVKYAPRNWEKGMAWSEMVRALKSHLTKWEMNQTMDDEFPDCHNMAMVAWNAIALLSYELREMPGDDRQKDLSVKPDSFKLND